MKRSLQTCLLLVLFATMVSAQSKKSYTVKPGEKVMDALPVHALYLYPVFKQGVVHFKNKNLGGAKLNYNRVLDQMQFIDNKGDTLSLDDEQNIASIAVDADTFYFYQGYVQKLQDLKNVKIGTKRMMVLSHRQKVGAMGGVSSSAIASYDRLSSQQGMRDLVPREYLTFSEHTYYFIGDAFNRFKPLSKKSVLNMYANKQSAVETYLKGNNVNFTDETDIKKPDQVFK
jgi:hypothetical protein